MSWSGGTLETGVGLEVEVESERVGDTVVDNSSYNTTSADAEGIQQPND
jgi:hypothetical protein